jgi:hypothetical protein
MFSVIGTTQAMQASQSFTHPSVPRYSTTISLVKAVEFNVIPGRACKNIKKNEGKSKQSVEITNQGFTTKKTCFETTKLSPQFLFFSLTHKIFGRRKDVHHSSFHFQKTCLLCKAIWVSIFLSFFFI